MSKSVSPAIVALLVPYLAARAAEWRACPEAGPTLPHKRESGTASIHVGMLVRDLAVNPEWRQHFKKRELRDLVNATCREQGLVGIGETAPPPVPAPAAGPPGDRRLIPGQLADVQAALLWQSRRISELEGQIGLAQSEGVLVRAGPTAEG